MEPRTLRPLHTVLSALSLLGGAVGMLLSFGIMASKNMEDITAVASGFVAGCLLVPAGPLSLTLLALKPSASSHAETPTTG